MKIVEEGAAGGFIGFPIPTTRVLHSSQTPGAISNLLSVRKSPMVAETTPREELQYHIHWQVSMLDESDLDWWADLPAYLTPVLENARELRVWPFRFPEGSEYEYRVVPEPVVVNLVTGAVRRLQRVAVIDM